MLGSKGTKNFKIDDIHRGVIHRFSDNSDDIALVMGTLNKVRPLISTQSDFNANNRKRAKLWRRLMRQK